MEQSERFRRLGAKVTALREQRKWSKNRLALYARMSRPWISQLEAGHYKEPSPVGLIRVAQVLGEDWREWFREIGLTAPRRIEDLEKELSPDVVELALRLQALTPAARRQVFRIVMPALEAFEIKPEQLERLEG